MGNTTDGERHVGRRRPDRGEAIEQADERTERPADERARNIGADTPGDPGAQLSQPEGDGNYQREGDSEVPLVGNPDADRE